MTILYPMHVGICVRDLDRPQLAYLRKNLEVVRRHGVPNYFDEQRFGNLSFGQGWVARELMLDRAEQALRQLLVGCGEFEAPESQRFKQGLDERWGDFEACRELAVKAGQHRSIFEHLVEHPRDAFVVAPASGVFGSIGFSGRVGRFEEQRAFLDPLAEHYGDDWWFLTVHAFALAETGEWERGRELAERAVELRPTNAHAAHTLAHVLYEGGADADALAYLSEYVPTTDPDGILHCHVWWHYALVLMTAGRVDEAWKAFTQNCLPGQRTSRRD